LRGEAGPAKIAVWGGGLHIDDLAPREGTRAGADRLAAQVRALAREATRRALRERLLHPPGSPQRGGLDAFRERCAAEGSPVAEIVRAANGPERRVTGR
jgi:hypothetical protein